MHQTSPAALLELMGLSSLEAHVYLHLLQSPPATGYGIAKAIRKPTANTYKALESLAEKGAILADDAPTRQYRAVPASDFLDTYSEKQKKLAQKLGQSLVALERPWTDDRVYQLTTVDQVVQCCRRMIKGAKRVILFDCFPEPMAIIGRDLERAAARGVQVIAKVYAPVSLKRVELLLPENPAYVLSRWPGQWCNGVVDGREHQLAFLSQDMSRVYQAVWTTSEYLSWIYHNGIASEFVHTAIIEVLNRGGSIEEVSAVCRTHRALLTMDAPGYAALLKRFGVPAAKNSNHKSKQR